MSLIRLAVTAIAVLTLLAGTTRAVVSALPLSFDGVGTLVQGSPAQLEIRRASLLPVRGYVATPVGGTNQVIYVDLLALATSADVSDARVVNAEGGLFAVEVNFQEEASTRMSRATAGLVGEPVAIVLDGRVVSAPVVRSPIGRSALLTGNFTRAQAEAIVNRLPPRILGAQLKPAPWLGAGAGAQAFWRMGRPRLGPGTHAVRAFRSGKSHFTSTGTLRLRV